MTWPKVAIIILNWNGWRDTIECLESLQRLTYPNYQIIVVDNGSTDDSMEKIKAWVESTNITVYYCKLAPHEVNAKIGQLKQYISGLNKSLSSITIIQIDENLGFARGNNIGIKFAIEVYDPEFVVVLNNDTYVEPDFLFPLIEAFFKYPSVGAVGPRIVDYGHQTVWFGYFTERPGFLSLAIGHRLSRIFHNHRRKRLPSEWSQDRIVYAIPGTCMVFSRQTLQLIHGFDEATFLYWEEFIIAEKLANYNMKTYFVPASCIYHKWEASSKNLAKARQFIENMKSEFYYFERYRNITAIQFAILKMLRLAIYAYRCLLYANYRKHWLEFIAVILSRSDFYERRT
ncbi:MAG: glycosyltransferase family 2 protein [Pyrobaculum sp.]